MTLTAHDIWLFRHRICPRVTVGFMAANSGDGVGTSPCFEPAPKWRDAAAERDHGLDTYTAGGRVGRSRRSSRHRPGGSAIEQAPERGRLGRRRRAKPRLRSSSARTHLHGHHASRGISVGRASGSSSDLGITVPFTWEGRNGDSQMIAGGPEYPIWFTNLIYHNTLYTLTYKWPNLTDHPCSRIPGLQPAPVEPEVQDRAVRRAGDPAAQSASGM